MKRRDRILGQVQGFDAAIAFYYFRLCDRNFPLHLPKAITTYKIIAKLISTKRDHQRSQSC